MKDIKPGEELLTWFDPKLLKRTKRRLSKMERKPVGYTIGCMIFLNIVYLYY